jgi:glycosyltransferase involved in cell wall biosynthesis
MTTTQHFRRPAVCIVRHNYYPDTHVRRDAEVLAQAGYDVSVVCLRRNGQKSRELLNGVEVYRLPVEHHRGSIPRYLWEYLAFFALAFGMVALLHVRKSFRVVEVDNMPDLLVFAATVPKLCGARILLYIFDNMPELFMVTRRVASGHPIVRVLGWLERVSASVADRVVVSQEVARRVVEKRGVPASKMAVVLNCPDAAFSRPRRQPLPRTQAHKFEIVTHGAIVERYGIQVLLDAFPTIAAHIPDARVTVYGVGEYLPELETRARALGIADRVHFAGFLPVEELVGPLAEAEVGYVGLLCDLMLPNKLMEYVALGVPAVVARWPTLTHYFSDDSVTYFNPGNADSLADAVLAIHRDPAAAREKAARALSLLDRYGWTTQRQLYLAIYADLLCEPDRALTTQTSRSTS